MKTKKFLNFFPLVFTVAGLAACGGHTHSISHVDAVPSTCITHGTIEHYVCDGCGKTFADAEGLEPLTAEQLVAEFGPHNYAAPTYEEIAGGAQLKATHVCSVCEHSESETVTGTFVSEVPAGCTTEGSITRSAAFSAAFGGTHQYTVATPANGHEFDEQAWAHDETNHWHPATCEHTSEKSGIEAHSFTESVISNEAVKTAPSCTEDGVYYKSCKCGYISTSDSDTFVGQGSALGHDVTALSVTTAPSKLSYVSGETLDKTGLVVEGTCSRCGTFTVDNSDLSVTYVNEGSTFLAGETSVTLGYKSSQTTVSVTGITVSKKANEITGLQDMALQCGETLDLSGVSSTFGNVTFELKDKDEETADVAEALSGLKAPYTLTASVEVGAEYLAASKTVTITVEHEDAPVCKCGLKAVDNFYYDLSTSSYYTADAIGPKAAEVKAALSFTDTAGDPLEFTAENAGQEFKVYGELQSGDDVCVNVLVVTKVITTLVELKDNCQVKAVTEVNNGFYVLGCDIDGQGAKYYDGDSIAATGGLSNDCGKWSWTDYGANGFRGTFDGRGHTISNFYLEGNGAGGLFFFVGWGGTIKNFNLKDIRNDHWWTFTALAYYAYHATFENISMSFAKLPDIKKSGQTTGQAATSGYIVAQRAEEVCTFKNIYIDASCGYIGELISHWIGEKTVFENCVIDCMGYNSYGTIDKPAGSTASGNNVPLEAMPNGITVNSIGEVHNNLALNDTNFSLEMPFPGCYSGKLTSIVDESSFETEKNEAQGKTLYYKDAEGNYVATTEYIAGKDYFKKTQENYQMWTRSFVDEEVEGNTDSKIMGKTGSDLAGSSAMLVKFNQPVTVDNTIKYVHMKYLVKSGETYSSFTFRLYRSDAATMNDVDKSHGYYIGWFRPGAFNTWVDLYIPLDKIAINGVLDGFTVYVESAKLPNSALYISQIELTNVKGVSGGVTDGPFQ